jgi:hypothetical protein
MAAHPSKDLGRKLEQAEAGDVRSAEELEAAKAADPETTAAVEQEAADGPKGRGVAM